MRALIAAGVMLLLTGLVLGGALLAGVRFPRPATRARRPSLVPAGRRWRRERLVAVPIALVVLLATGWVGAGLGAGALVLMAQGLVHPSAASQRHITRLEALASWTRRLADLLASGAAATMQDALTRAAVTSPPAIRTETRALTSRMGPQGMERALRRFAAELADPVGDHVAMALIVRDRHGATALADVLTALATDVDEQVRMRRGIVSEQKKAIGNVRMILAVTVLAWVGLSVFARAYLTPYDTALGQLALSVIVAGFLATLAWLARLSRPVTGDRFLADLDDTPATPVAPGQPRTGNLR